MVSDKQVESTTERVLAIRHSLLKLHKVLLEWERQAYERAHGRVESSYKVLHLVMNDPWFTWLHRLSELLVQMDEMLDQEKPPDKSDLSTLVDQTRALLTPSEVGSEFQRKYFIALQQSPDAVLAHAEVAKLLGKKPSRIH